MSITFHIAWVFRRGTSIVVLTETWRHSGRDAIYGCRGDILSIPVNLPTIICVYAEVYDTDLIYHGSIPITIVRHLREHLRCIQENTLVSTVIREELHLRDYHWSLSRNMLMYWNYRTTLFHWNVTEFMVQRIPLLMHIIASTAVILLAPGRGELTSLCISKCNLHYHEV